MLLNRIFRNYLTKSFGRQYASNSSNSGSRIERIRNNGDTLELDISSITSTRTYTFDSLWLRFNCHSRQSKQSGSGQRIIDCSKIPFDLKISKCSNDESNLYIEWANKDAVKTEIPIDYLVEKYPQDNYDLKMDIDKYSSKSLQIFDYNDFKGGSGGTEQLQDWMKCIYLYGHGLLRNVPTQNGRVKEIGRLICPIQSTIYGDIFDVEATPNPINIAYSNHSLDYHMDLIYYESAPGLQFLHCIKNDKCVVGGESILLDIFKAAHDFRTAHPDSFNILATQPVTFQKIHFDRDWPVYMSYRKPHFILNHENKIVNVNWAPAFEGPFAGESPKKVKEYYQSYLLFENFLQNHSHRIEYLLKPGDVICFNNRRILHGRKQFELNGGSRHLQGCYLNIDEFSSAVRYGELKRHANFNQLPPIAIGNNDYSVGF